MAHFNLSLEWIVIGKLCISIGGVLHDFVEHIYQWYRRLLAVPHKVVCLRNA